MEASVSLVKTPVLKEVVEIGVSTPLSRFHLYVVLSEVAVPEIAIVGFAPLQTVVELGVSVGTVLGATTTVAAAVVPGQVLPAP